MVHVYVPTLLLPKVIVPLLGEILLPPIMSVGAKLNVPEILSGTGVVLEPISTYRLFWLKVTFCPPPDGASVIPTPVLPIWIVSACAAGEKPANITARATIAIAFFILRHLSRYWTFGF
jgi:hypothetical protein